MVKKDADAKAILKGAIDMDASVKYTKTKIFQFCCKRLINIK